MLKSAAFKALGCAGLLAACVLCVRPALAQSADDQERVTTADPKYNEIVAKLGSMKTSLDFTDAEMTDVIDFVSQLTGINFVIDQRVYRDMRPEELKVTISVKDVPVRTALKLILGLRGLTAEYREGALLVMPKKSLEEEVYLKMYDVRDLMFRIQDFPAPEISLKSGSEAEVSVAFSDEPPAKFTDPNFIVDVIKQNCGGDTWERVEGASVAMAAGGVLLVTQSQAVHKEIAKLINLLRMYK